MGRLFLLFCVVVAHASSAAYNSQTTSGSRLLILFLDGLRHDYFDHVYDTGGVYQMRVEGCYVPKVKPVFPSSCFTNTHALFAGRQSQHFSSFNISSDIHFTHRDLLWFRAAAEGKHVKLYHFPFCSDISEEGIECISRRKYWKYTLKSTLAGALHSLANESTDLAIVYYDELDTKGHLFGASMDVMMENDTIFNIDEAILDVVKYIKVHPEEKINFVIVSDHGMMDLEGFVTAEHRFMWYDIDRIVNHGAVAGIWPKPHAFQGVFDYIRGDSEYFKTYTPETLPMEAWPSSELPPIIILASPPYFIDIRYHPFEALDHLNPHKMPKEPKGAHGYLSTVEEMLTTFLAYGPAFSQGCGIHSNENFSTYDIFPIIHKALFSEPPSSVTVPSTTLKPTESGTTITTSTTTTASIATAASTTTTAPTATTTMLTPKPDAISSTRKSFGWEIKVAVGVICTLFAIILLLALVIVRLLKVRHVPNDRIRLFDDFAEAKFWIDHQHQHHEDSARELRV